MATTYHVNPLTGDAGACRAKSGKCPFGTLDEHYTSLAAARKAYEEQQDPTVRAEKTIKVLSKQLVRNTDLDFDTIAFDLEKILEWEQLWNANDFANLETIKKIAEVVERDPFTPKDQKEAEKLVGQLIPAKIYPRQRGGWTSSDTTWRARDKMLNSLGVGLLKRRIFDQLTYEPADPVTNDRLIGLPETQDAFLKIVNHPPYSGYDGACLGPVEEHFQEAIARVVRGDEALNADELASSDHRSLLPPQERIFNALHPDSTIFEPQLYLTSVFPVRELKEEMDRVGIDGVTVTPFYNTREWGNVYTVIEPDGSTRSFSVYEHRNSDSIIINGKKNWGGQGELPYAADSKNEFFAEFGPDDHKRAASALVFFMAEAKQGKLSDDRKLTFDSPKRDWHAILSEQIPGFKAWAEKNMGIAPRPTVESDDDILGRLDFDDESA